jgi:phage tail sheath protein FI
MAQLKFGSAGVTTREIDLSGPVAQQPVGVPAGIIGTSLKGPAFVPITVGTLSDWYAKFGQTDGKKFGPLAVTEWLRNARALTYVKVLGVGDGKQRAASGNVTNAGFVVGENQPLSTSDYALAANPYANPGQSSVLGRTYFLGAFMSESAGSTIFSSAGLQGLGSITPGVSTSLPILRGVLMAASGVILRLSSSAEGTNTAPASTLIATDATANGNLLGSVVLLDSSVAKQEFVLLLNGHKGTDSLYPNVISASLDITANNYFANVLNTDPLKFQQAGHYLYSSWDIHPIQAVVTGSGLVHAVSGAGGSRVARSGAESSVFLTTSSLTRNSGNSYVPNYESFVDRFSAAKSPWLVSQKFGGSAYNLFRLHALDDGASTTYKISIENITPSTDLTDRYGTFDIVLRSISDRDLEQLPIEKFSGLSLDPNSDRYISKIIGDTHAYYDFDRAESAQKLIIDGMYQNNSNYIRVEVDSSIENSTLDATALPFGFRGISHLVTSGSMPMTSPVTTQLSVAASLKRTITPPLPMRKDISNGSGVKKIVEPRYYWGTHYEHVESLSTQNASTLANNSLVSHAKYFPDFSLTNQNFAVGDNVGDVDTAENGIIDSDRFCTNFFSLENIQVITASTTLADSAQWKSAAYVRNGVITADDTAKTRRVQVSDFTQANRRYLKYTLPMQGGFDGVNLFDNDEAEINNAAVTADMNSATRNRNEGPNVKAYAKAIEIMQNVVSTDIQLLVIPGIRHPVITNAAIAAVQDRFDALFIMDIEQYDYNNDLVTLDSQIPSVQLTAQNLSDRALDSSFAATYFPDVVVQDPTTKTNVIVPPSVVVLGALALNDAIGYPWFAPAGTTRGALSTTLEARIQLSKTNMDALYDVSINPLVAFPGNATSGTNPKGGVLVWGQKTLQVAASSLDRVNVRRLLIELRRQVRDIAQIIIFEPNREATLAKFSAAVTPRLQRIQALAGLERFKVVIDSSTTTQLDVENNTLRGKIYVQPSKSIEYISLDFVVSNNGTQG